MDQRAFRRAARGRTFVLIYLPAAPCLEDNGPETRPAADAGPGLRIRPPWGGNENASSARINARWL